MLIRTEKLTVIFIFFFFLFLFVTGTTVRTASSSTRIPTTFSTCGDKRCSRIRNASSTTRAARYSLSFFLLLLISQQCVRSISFVLFAQQQQNPFLAPLLTSFFFLYLFFVVGWGHFGSFDDDETELFAARRASHSTRTHECQGRQCA